MDKEQVLPDQTVVIEDGRITVVGPFSKVRVPANATRIDGTGKYLIPGLAEMHTHNFGAYADERTDDGKARRLFTYLATGVTAFRDIGRVMPEDGTRIRFFKAAPIPRPHIYISPKLLEFQFSSTKLPKLDSVAAYVAAYKRVGYDFVSVPALPKGVESHEARAVVDSFIAAARGMGMPMADHDVLTFEQILAMGATGASEHIPEPIVAIVEARGTDSVDLSKIKPIARAIKQAGVWITPTMTCYEPGGDLANLKHTDQYRRILKALHDEGVGLLLGSDASYAHRRSPSMVHTELEAMVRAGLTPYQALVTGTRNVAQYFGILDSVGTIAVGKRADLVLLDGNPLTDIRHSRAVAGTMIDGRWLSRVELDRGLIPTPALAGLRSWLAVELSSSFPAGWTELSPLIERFEQLSDSLEIARTFSKEDGGRWYQRLLQLVTEDLAALRARLRPEYHNIFDSAVRVWLRVQVSQGYQATITGVRATP